MPDLPGDVRWPALEHYDKARELYASANDTSDLNNPFAQAQRQNALIQVLFGLLAERLHIQ